MLLTGFELWSWNVKSDDALYPWSHPVTGHVLLGGVVCGRGGGEGWERREGYPASLPDAHSMCREGSKSQARGRDMPVWGHSTVHLQPKKMTHRRGSLYENRQHEFLRGSTGIS